MTPHPVDLSLEQMAHAMRSGELSSVALTRAHLDRIAARDADIGAFVHIDAEGALVAAARADARFAQGVDHGPLQGIPFAVKDLVDVAGWPVRFGSGLHQGRIAEVTAPAIARLMEAGAVPLGLLATYELATVGPDDSSLYSQPRNPWQRDHVSGGSSSGSAAALSAGMLRLAIGTDTGGSIRSPAAYCGIVGLKPTNGSLPMQGVMALSPTLDIVGPMGRTVADVAALFAVLAGRDVALDGDLAGMRVAYGRGWCDDLAAHDDLQTRMDDALSALSLLGMKVDLCDMPDYAPIESAASTILRDEQTRSQADVIADGGRSVGRMAFGSIAGAAPPSATDVAAARALGVATTAAIDAILAQADLLVLPTVMAPAPRFSEFAAGRAVWTAMRTIPFNLTGHPALSLPMGFAAGLPLGLQIVGPHGAEDRLLRVAAGFEAATDHGVLIPCFPEAVSR